MAESNQKTRRYMIHLAEGLSGIGRYGRYRCWRGPTGISTPERLSLVGFRVQGVDNETRFQSVRVGNVEQIKTPMVPEIFHPTSFGYSQWRPPAIRSVDAISVEVIGPCSAVIAIFSPAPAVRCL